MREGPPWLCISSSAGKRKRRKTKRRKTNWTQSEVRSRSSNRGFGWKFRFLSSPLLHPRIIISTFFFPFSSSEYSTLLRSHPLPPLVGSPVNLSGFRPCSQLVRMGQSLHLPRYFSISFSQSRAARTNNGKDETRDRAPRTAVQCLLFQPGKRTTTYDIVSTYIVCTVGTPSSPI
ncbi:hypothetical protein LZ31DRAFT_215409 [Colletotrichum somersetense]|nr:hypothetical protein LZ31DRAFT_215409 [Colletotrichum somersetense]